MIYLDNSATTKQYHEVSQLMLKYMEESFGNPSSLYQLGLDSEKAIKTARKQVEKAMGFGGTNQGRAYFTSGGTEADNMAIFGATTSLKRIGNKIITSKVEHPAVLECFKELERRGFETVYIDVDRNCRLDEKQLEAAIDEQTILVSLMHVNNEVGTIMPVDKVKDIIRRKNSPALFHCDAVQSFCKLPMPKDVDLLAVSGHKVHGPKGSGALYVKKGINMPALILGGGQEDGQRSGTENVAAIAGLGLASQMSTETRKADMKAAGDMRAALIKGLTDNLDDIIINSPMEAGEEAGQGCASVLSVTFMGTRGEVILHTLEGDGIYVSTGSACSSNKKGQSHVLTAMGFKDKEIEGTIRFSLGRFNSMEEMDQVVDKVTGAVKRFRKLGSFR